MVIAFYPGSFDPFHNGHLAIANAASEVFDKLIIGVGNNPDKSDYLIDHQNRFELVQNCFSGNNKIKVMKYEGLTTTAAGQVNAVCIVKGVRSSTDLDDEMLQARINSASGKQINTVFMPGVGEFALVSSRYLRQVSILGQDLSKLVPSVVAQYLIER